jgi:hypothetical protein
MQGTSGTLLIGKVSLVDHTESQQQDGGKYFNIFKKNFQHQVPQAT